MATLDHAVARPVGAVLLLGIGMVHFICLPRGFRYESYVGVSLIIGVFMALAGATGMLVERRDRIWWYALAEGVLNEAGFLLSRSPGLPLVDQIHQDWFSNDGLALAFFALVLTVLSAWALADRRHRRRRGFPVMSAVERQIMTPVQRPKDPPG